MGIDSKRFVAQPVDTAFVCSICNDVYADPVQCPDEHIYCEACIRQWLTRKSSCPLDQKGLALGDLRPTPRVFRNMLDNLEIKCDFCSVGCPVATSLSAIKDHEADCQFSGAGEGKLDRLERLITDLGSQVRDLNEELVKTRVELTLVREDADRKSALIADLESKLTVVDTRLAVDNTQLKLLAEMAVQFAQATGELCDKWTRATAEGGDAAQDSAVSQAGADFLAQLVKEVTISPRVRAAMDVIDFSAFTADADMG